MHDVDPAKRLMGRKVTYKDEETMNFMYETHFTNKDESTYKSPWEQWCALLIGYANFIKDDILTHIKDAT